MAHFAKVINSVVIEVIVAEQEFIDTLPDKDFWVQTSYNTYGGVHYDPETNKPDGGVPLRKNYACIGYQYDSKRDAFIPPTPFPSWVLNEQTCLWEAPIVYPEDGYTDDNRYGRQYIWNEFQQEWTPTGYIIDKIMNQIIKEEV